MSKLFGGKCIEHILDGFPVKIRQSVKGHSNMLVIRMIYYDRKHDGKYDGKHDVKCQGT